MDARRPPRRVSARAIALIVVAATTLTPATTGAQQGPGGYGGDPAPTTADGPVSGGLLSRHAELLGSGLLFKGTIDSRFAGGPVALQRRLADGSWSEFARTTADAGGAFRTTWTTDHIGRFVVRAIPVPAEATTAAVPSTPTRAITVYRPARATIFGPGMYGERTACGKRLTRRLQGVAHRTLPCGTLVDLYYRGRVVTVPVIDRGPFRKGVSWDLTSATADALRLTTTDTIGAVRVRPVSR